MSNEQIDDLESYSQTGDVCDRCKAEWDILSHLYSNGDIEARPYMGVLFEGQRLHDHTHTLTCDLRRVVNA